MKKIFFLLVVYLCFSGKALAKTQTYYSAYGPFTEFSEEKILPNELTSVEKERRYLWYKENIVGDYFLAGQNPKEYNLMSSKTIIETSPFSETKPLEASGRVIESKVIYGHQEAKKGKIIKITALEGEFNLMNLNVEVSGEVKDFTLSNQDKVVTLKENDSLVITLKEFFPLDKLKLSFDVLNNSLKSSYQISVLGDDEQEYLKGNYTNYFQSKDESDTRHFTYDINNLPIYDLAWQEEVISEEPIQETPLKRPFTRTLYRTVDTKNWYYKVERIYNDTYTKDATDDYNLCDESKYKDYYRSQVRNKVTIEDEVTLTTKNINFKDYIKEATVDFLSVDSNIDFKKNGTYEVVYKYPFGNFKTIVHLDIKDNEKNYTMASMAIFIPAILIINYLIYHAWQKKSTEK